MKKVHFGPGKHWKNPDETWISVDREPGRAQIVTDFNKNFEKLPLENSSVSCIYGSHVFEHMNIFVAPLIFKECHRILISGGVFRLVLPDVRKSIEQYLKGNSNYPLFKLRLARGKKLHKRDYTLFECLKEDFLSGYHHNREMAHQNAWDFPAIVRDLNRAGFDESKIKQMKFRQSNCPDFAFEGTYPAEANNHERSLYVEAIR
jgi:predicted SAM-dependent methyltransferase